MLATEEVHVRHTPHSSGLAVRSSSCPCAFGHAQRDLDMCIVAGCGEALDWPSEKLNEKLELVQKARLGPGHDWEATVLNRSVTVQRLWTDVGSRPTPRRIGRAWTSGGASRVEPQEALSRTQHWTTRNWSLMGRKPITACQQDWDIWHETDPTSRLLAWNAAARLGRQRVQTHTPDTCRTRFAPHDA